MAYKATCTVVLKDGTTQQVEATGDSRNEALEHLSNAAVGINVAGVFRESIRTDKVRGQ